MRRLLILACVLAVPSLALAESNTSDRQGGQGKSGGVNNPGAPSSTDPGNAKPCDKSASSDRGGGNEKTSSASTNNPGGGVKGSGC